MNKEINMFGKTGKKQVAVFTFCSVIILAQITLIGCVTAEVLRQTESKAESQNVSKSRILVIGKADGGISIDGVSISNSSFGRDNNILELVPGMHRITIRESRTVGAGILENYYTEIWNHDFEFEQGKVYTIQVENHARLAIKIFKEEFLTSDVWVTQTIGGKEYAYGITSNTPGLIAETKNGGPIQVEHPVNEDVIVSVSRGSPLGAMLGNTYIGLEYTPNIQLGWRLGSSIAPEFGPRLGIRLINGGFDLRLMGEAGGGPIISFFRDPFVFGTGFSYYYGGLAEFYFSSIGIGLGGGYTGAWAITSNVPDGGPENRLFSFPYVEADIMFPKLDGRGIYFQYYFTESSNFIDKFGVGIKMHP
ncbi:MAG: DUF2057 domain-containing protein [Treponema sp.]|nr:DUF2057 domain-containing protein [Treponema sp.]